MAKEDGGRVRGQRDFSPARIDQLDQVRAYIEAIDLEPIKKKILDGHSYLDWPRGKLEYIERQYRNLLYLWRKHEDVCLPPSEEIDEIWHHHLLDTHRYFADCERIFGYYRHHFPYFGLRGREDEAALWDAFTMNTQRLYLAEYGEYIYDFEPIEIEVPVVPGDPPRPPADPVAGSRS